MEHAEPMNRAEARSVAMARGQEERIAAIFRKHDKPRLVHREVAPLRSLRCAQDLDRLSSDRAVKLPAFGRKLPGVQVVLAHLLGPIRGEGAMGGARHGVF